MKKKILLILLFLIPLSLFAAPPGGGDRHFGRPGKNPPGTAGNNPGEKNPPPAKPPEPKKSRSSDSKASSLNFRGQRMTVSETPLSVSRHVIEKKSDRTYSVELSFNQSINPASIQPENVIVNEKSVEDEIKFTFNKKTDSIIFCIYCEEIMSLEFKNIETFAGIKTERLIIDLTGK